MKTAEKNSAAAVIFIVAVFAVFAAVLAVPVSRGIFGELSSEHPYIMGFVKFAFLATAGELIALRLAKGRFAVPSYLVARFVIWGVIGVWITYMMKIFFIGSGAMMEAGLLPSGGEGFLGTFLRALFTSVTMNLSFGPTFMAIHKCSDTYLALRSEQGGKSPSLFEVIGAVDWHRFVSFTLFKTVPIFWIPAHTVTFLLPSEYQVMLAALLSVVLGIILNIKIGRK